jgi:hypothetical protein
VKCGRFFWLLLSFRWGGRPLAYPSLSLTSWLSGCDSCLALSFLPFFLPAVLPKVLSNSWAQVMFLTASQVAGTADMHHPAWFSPFFPLHSGNHLHGGAQAVSHFGPQGSLQKGGAKPPLPASPLNPQLETVRLLHRPAHCPGQDAQVTCPGQFSR